MCAPVFHRIPRVVPQSKERQHYMPQYPIIPHEQMGILQKHLCSHMEHVPYKNIWGSHIETMFPWEHMGLGPYDIEERRGFYIKLMDIWVYRLFSIGSSWRGYLCAECNTHVTSLWWCKWPGPTVMKSAQAFGNFSWFGGVYWCNTLQTRLSQHGQYTTPVCNVYAW